MKMCDIQVVLRDNLTAVALAAALAIASAAFALDPNRALTQSRLSVWTIDDGLPQNTVDAMVQTRDGYLWIGTEEGLVRFDGARFVSIDRHDWPMGSTFVTCLAETSDGTLWVGTYGGGVARLRNGRLEPFHPNALGADRFRDVHLSPSGVIYMATAGGGLIRVEGDRITRFTTRDGLPIDRIWSLEEDGQGGLWVATHGGGVIRWRDGKVLQRITTAEGLPNDFARALLREADGTMWIGTDGGGLVAWRDGAITQVITAREGLPSDLVRTMRRDRDGSLWIGTDGGLARWRGGRMETVTVAQGLPSPNIRTLLEDHEGSLWAGTTGGLLRLQDTRFVPITRKEGFTVDGVRALREDRDGRIWAGTEGGGICEVSRVPVQCLTTANGLPHDTVFALAASQDGSLWVGTNGAGVVRLREGRFSETIDARSRGLPSNRVRALIETPNGDLWVSTSSGLVVIRGGRTTTVRELRDLQVRPILGLPDGSLLAGTDGAGLWRVTADGSRATLVATVGKGLESDRVFSLALDTDGGGVWIGTSGGGLARFDLASGSVRSLTRRQGLFDNVVFQVLDPGPGTDLWLTSNRGLYRIARDQVRKALNGVEADLSGKVYGAMDGMPSPECNAAFPGAVRSRDGRIWVATARGVAVVDPTSGLRNTTPPPVVVEEVLLDGVAARPGELRVPPGTERLELHYTAFSYRSPDRVTFRYQLDAYDRGWVDAGVNRVATYTKPAPGTYTFRVIAANEDGVWSTTEARRQLTVNPRWFETWWARLLALTLFAAGLWATVRLRTAALHERHARMEALVAERTSSLRAETERAEAASRAKSDFLANMSHELRTPLNAVLGFVQLMERRAGRDPADREHLAIISRSGEHLLGLINDVLSLSKIEAGLATRTDAPFNLARLLRGLGELLQLKARNKDLTVRIEVDPSADVTVSGDEGKLRQIVINLLGNAVKFTERGSVVLRASWSEGRGIVEVEDSGPGIDAKELDLVFEAFAQTESGRAASEGAGLGLAISRRLARIHGGDVTIRSRPGQGTTVRVEVELPLASELAAAERIRRTGRVIGFAPGQDIPLVLVVDDSADNRKLLAELLRTAGCRVAEAGGGVEGLEVWRRERPALVFMDLRMPEVDGLEATTRIRAAEAETQGRPATRIVVISASAFEHERTEALQRGADAFLAKPFREDSVFGLLENLLGVRLLREQDAAAVAGHGVLSAHSLSLLPPDLRDRLSGAAAGGEADVLQRLAEEAGRHDAAIGTELAVLARSYRFDEIEAALAVCANAPEETGP